MRRRRWPPWGKSLDPDGEIPPPRRRLRDGMVPGRAGVPGKGVRLSTATNRAVVRRFVEGVLGRGDFAALNALAASDCADHADVPGVAPCPEAIAHFLATWRAAFPDLAITVEDLVAAGDRVAAHWTLRGTHRGPFLGLSPTGRQVAVGGMELYRLADGRIAERWAVVDLAGLLRQLGPSPTAVPTGERTPASIPA